MGAACGGYQLFAPSGQLVRVVGVDQPPSLDLGRRVLVAGGLDRDPNVVEGI